MRASSLLSAAAFLLVACSVDTEKYTFVAVDGGMGGCVDDACTACAKGFAKVGNTCADVDECKQNLDDCDPSPDACVNRDNGQGYVCQCPMGYEGNGIGNDGCKGTTPCAEGTIDLNGDGSECYKPFEAVAAGLTHACALRAGELYCWGEADRGQLGLGDGEADTRMHERPTRVGEAADWTSITLGPSSSCGVQGKALSCFGRNDHGQLGIGTMEPAFTPTPVKTEDALTALTLGAEHSCALQGDLLLCWGSNQDGRLGLGADAMDQLVPTRVGDAGSWTAIATGDRHTCGIRAGELFCWGANQFSQLGLGTMDAQAEPASVDATGTWEKVAAGTQHSCAIRAGELYCFGTNGAGQLGLGDDMARATPTQVGTDADWSAVLIAGARTCGLRGKALFCWGAKLPGQTDAASEPTAMAADHEWDSIAMGGAFICGLSGGALYCWGENSKGQLGVGDHDPHEGLQLVQ